MDKSTHDVRASQWTQIIEQCQSRPVYQTAKQWLQENDIKPSVYYYWQRKLRNMAYETACTEITPMAEGKPVAVAKAEEDVAFAEIPFSLGTDTEQESPQKDYLFQPRELILQRSADFLCKTEKFILVFTIKSWHPTWGVANGLKTAKDGPQKLINRHKTAHFKI